MRLRLCLNLSGTSVRGARIALLPGDPFRVPAITDTVKTIDTFYPGQERYDSFSRYVREKFRGSLLEWQRLHVLNFEMESSTVLTLSSSMGLKGGCVAGVVCNRLASESINNDMCAIGEEQVIDAAVSSLRYLLE